MSFINTLYPRSSQLITSEKSEPALNGLPPSLSSSPHWLFWYVFLTIILSFNRGLKWNATSWLSTLCLYLLIVTEWQTRLNDILDEKKKMQIIQYTKREENINYESTLNTCQRRRECKLLRAKRYLVRSYFAKYFQKVNFFRQYPILEYIHPQGIGFPII